MAPRRSSDLIAIALVLLLFGALGVDARAARLVGHVYMQTNETQNRIMHFGRNADGRLELLESVPTRGAGSGVFKPVSGQESAPNAFEGAGSVILAESNTLLFTTNGGDNSVTSFRVGPDGKLTVLDRQPPREPVTGRSGTAKSLAYRPQSRTRYALHAFGPNHVRAYTVAEDGKLKLRPERHTVNTATKTDRAARASGCGGEVTRAGAARWTEWALRLSLATAFLSAVGDRLGAWGPHGSPHASWGDWHHFRIYADQLNWYMPAAVQPAAAVLATAGEVIFATALITGFRLREAAIGSGVLLTIFGISMALTLGMKAPLDYSVFTAATASFSLAAMAADHKRENPSGRKS